MKRIASLIFILIPILVLYSCEKEKMPMEDMVYTYETDSIIDIDGNVYRIVRIGDQWWMSENLRVKRYRDGTGIYYNASMTASEWAGLSGGAFCNLNDSPVATNGSLYNWYAVVHPNGLAPQGWRIPTEEDWKKLEKFIGMPADVIDLTGWRGSDEGEKLKSRKTEKFNWRYDPAMNHTDQFGFRAFPGGLRLFNGSFGESGGSAGFWWSSTDSGTGDAWYRHLDYRFGGVFRYSAPVNSGLSIRCVKDAE
jgi:uncharacterized protein (TIGR02145 family)